MLCDIRFGQAEMESEIFTESSPFLPRKVQRTAYINIHPQTRRKHKHRKDVGFWSDCFSHETIHLILSYKFNDEDASIALDSILQKVISSVSSICSYSRGIKLYYMSRTGCFEHMLDFYLETKK